jgi:hypothetical protein
MSNFDDNTQNNLGRDTGLAGQTAGNFLPYILRNRSSLMSCGHQEGTDSKTLGIWSRDLTTPTAAPTTLMGNVQLV